MVTTMKRFASCSAVLLLAFLLGTSPAMGANIGLTVVGVTAGIAPVPVPTQGKTFYKATFYFNYPGTGPVTFSGNNDGTGDTAVDEYVVP